MGEYAALEVGFVLLFAAMMAIDLLFVHKKSREMPVREAGLWCMVWVALALAFGGAIWWRLGQTKALQFTAGYLLEYSLSVDNMFVFVLIFRYFAIPKLHQARVLHWGILGAIVMRLLFIAAGVELIQRLHWMIYVFGALLIYTAFKMYTQGDEEIHPEKNPALKLLKMFLPVLTEDRGSAFLVKENGRTYATPLLASLMVVEFSDVVFALDSIPAIIGITPDPFIVYTSNIFAIMGLRSLYFLLAGLMDGLVYLKAGISAILAFVGVKMLGGAWGLHVSVGVSLSVIVLVLAVSVGASLLHARRTKAGS